MSQKEIDNDQGFRVSALDIDLHKHWIVKYRVKTQQSMESVGLFIAKIQSTSTYQRLLLETEELRIKRSAKLISIDGNYLTIAHPEENISDNLSYLLLAIYLEKNPSLFEELVVEDITPPTSSQSIDGLVDTLRLFQRTKELFRPLLMVVSKPSLGLSTPEYLHLTKQAFLNGADIVKDDENLIPNDLSSPLTERVEKIAELMVGLPDKHNKMYLFNVQDVSRTLDDIKYIEKQAEKHDVRFAIMLSVLQGLPWIQQVRKLTKLPIFIHSAGIGQFIYGPVHFSLNAYAKLLRIAGANVVISVPPKTEVYEFSIQNTIDLHNGCTEAMNKYPALFTAFGGRMDSSSHKTIKPVFGNEYGFIAGGAVHGHSQGVRAGINELLASFN